MARPRVVVVDDSADFLSLAAEILSADTYDVVPFGGLATTPEEIERANPDVIVLDLAFGSDDNAGWDLLGRLRGRGGPASQTPVIVCSGAVETVRRHRDDFGSLSGVMLLEKPFAVHEFESLVRDATGLTLLAEA